MINLICSCTATKWRRLSISNLQEKGKQNESEYNFMYKIKLKCKWIENYCNV